MDLYADDLADYIYQENDVDKKRALLLKVEAEIKKLMGEQEKGSLDLKMCIRDSATGFYILTY